MFTYNQSTGLLTRDGTMIAAGYSGHGDGRNNPAMEATRLVGPIPCGLYHIGPAFHASTTLGPVAMRLMPVSHDALGRSGFFIHGDSVKGDASHGCIVLPRPVRLFIAHSGDKDLTVVSGLAPLAPLSLEG
jgi:hypothetical protein